MKHLIKSLPLLAFVMLCFVHTSFAQKVAFISSDVIRDKFQEAKSADQRVKSIVDEWKRELEEMDKKIEDLKFDIKKNRLIWSDDEKRSKDKELEELQVQKMEFARRKFEAGGEYDIVVKQMMQPIEDKIYAAVQQVAAEEGYDLIWDKSLQPLAYVNSKFDLTIKVLRKLGVDVKALEKELQDKIDKDPRNQKKDTKSAPGKRTRATESTSPTKEIKRDDGQLPDSKRPTGIVPPDPNNIKLDPGSSPMVKPDSTQPVEPLRR